MILLPSHAGIIYVLGAVGRPGGFVVANDRTEFTVLKLLSLAGGYTRIAKLGEGHLTGCDREKFCLAVGETQVPFRTKNTSTSEW